MEAPTCLQHRPIGFRIAAIVYVLLESPGALLQETLRPKYDLNFLNVKDSLNPRRFLSSPNESKPGGDLILPTSRSTSRP
jgi:hypothetical protein